MLSESCAVLPLTPPNRSLLLQLLGTSQKSKLVDVSNSSLSEETSYFWVKCEGAEDVLGPGLSISGAATCIIDSLTHSHIILVTALASVSFSRVASSKHLRQASFSLRDGAPHIHKALADGWLR